MEKMIGGRSDWHMATLHDWKNIGVGALGGYCI